MRSTPAASVLGFLLFGLICSYTAEEGTTLEEDIQKVINQIHFLSGADEQMRGFSNTGEAFSLHSYYDMLSNLLALVPPLLGDRFMDELPKMLVCILSGEMDCGLKAELTKTVSVQLVEPLLNLLSSPALQTCPQSPSSGADPVSFRTGEAAAAATVLDGFQQTVMNILQSLPLSGHLKDTLSSVMDAAVKNVLTFSVSLLQLPLEYMNIALQFGIRVPSLDDKETCEQGDLKQLIMWGIHNNMSWSFAPSLVDVLLELFLEQVEPLCAYGVLDCQTPPIMPFQRSLTEATRDSNDIFLKCDRHNLAQLNDTVCADVLRGSSAGSSTSVLALCQALGSLSPHQLEQVWSNLCSVVQALVSPVVGESPYCGDGDVTDSIATAPPSQAAPRRAAREAPNLRQLACNYDVWMEALPADDQFVSLCSDNDREEFEKRVCSNADFMKKLLSDAVNSWLYAYCANSSADSDYLVSHFCVYQQWIEQPTGPVATVLLEFCMNLDGPRMTSLMCKNIQLLVFVLADPENIHLMPNCTNLPTPPPLAGPDLGLGLGPGSLGSESCRYSQWHDLTQITTDNLMHCTNFDQAGFTQEVCGNSTIIDTLLQDEEHVWLREFCNASLASLSQTLNIAEWCDYDTWAERQVDVSVVALCWQNDQLAFQSKVCCQTSVLEKLQQDPQNQWLVSACTNMDMHELLKVCKYSDWSKPIIVDMTELALCAELDQLNFTSKVCTNGTILQNLLANQDNTWLVQYCANHSKSAVSLSGDGEGGGDPSGFKPAEQCQYSSWSISLPGVALLTLCWENDQTHFISSVCPNTALLLKLSQESYSAWVSSMCTTFANYTSETTTPTTTTTNSPAPEPDSCWVRNLVKQFHLNCSVDFTSACQPGISQNQVLKMMVHCWVESLEARVEELLTAPVAAMLEQALSTTVVFLLAVEEVQASSLHIIKNINLSVLKSVAQYLEKEKTFENKKVLLQCFGTVLTSLMQAPRDMTRNEFPVIKEYFNIPLSSLRSVLRAAHINTVRLILQYYSSHRDTLQLSDKYLSTMMSVLLQTHVVRDESFFPELAPLLASANPTDILALPSLQNDKIVTNAINRNLVHMTLEQRQAFGSWYSKVMPPSKIIEGHESLIADTGDLIVYLPFRYFQHLSRAQLMNGLDVLLRNNLTSLKKEFIAYSLVGNLTVQDFIRLGKMSCLADPKDLLLYKGTEAFTVIQDIVMNCTHDDGLILPNYLISSVLLNSTKFKVPSSLGADRLAEIAHLLPLMGINFLQGLTPAQLLTALPALSNVSFSPAQASVIVDKLSSITTLTGPNKLQELGSLIVGMRAETFLTLTSARLLSSLPAIAQHSPGLSPHQVNAIASKLWGYSEVVVWLKNHQVDTLLYCTPLVSVLPRIGVLVNDVENITTNFYNTQQAKAIFREALETKPNLIEQRFLSLGTLGQGASCEFLKERFRADGSQNAVVEILQFLRQQPRPLHTSLKKCLIEELYKLEFFPQLLKDLGAELAVSMPVSTITKFSTDDMNVLRTTILQDPRHFLLLPRTKQALLVDKMVQRMGMYTGVFTQEEFRSLGIMSPFVLDEVFIQMDRSFFIDNLSSLLGLCYTQSKMNLVALILQEPAVFGPVKTWNKATLIQVDRFLFFLSKSTLQEISPALMTVGYIEKLFISQRRWERGDVGASCLKSVERLELFRKQQFVLQFFLGFLKINHLSSIGMMVPTCEILHSIPPAAWPPSSLTSMSPTAFSNCLELMGHDPFFESYQRSQVLNKVKQLYGPVSSFSQSLISQLAALAVEMSVEELSSLRLVERRSIAALGAISDWTDTQLAALFTTVLRSTRRVSPSQLDSSTLVAMGYIVCGATVADMNLFNAVEFSKAVLFLGQLRLPCSEEQLDVLVGLLSHTLAFGTISSWGTDVFIEIGVLAAGLPDLAMSALVKEQIEGITPTAISVIPPERFYVALNHRQISMFSYEQAAAVTDAQISALSEVQKTALSLALTLWENRPVDFRGRSRGLALSYSPLCLTLGLLMLLTVLSGPDVP
ncbi:stereocilin [Solea solea]|uniref:stereocilin n=1 Tax=Solea solea TaxID=90069 RepID=UPI00272AD9E7|nr:stereocilin [Solea solea]